MYVFLIQSRKKNLTVWMNLGVFGIKIGLSHINKYESLMNLTELGK